jgi:hypothetical protein
VEAAGFDRVTLESGEQAGVLAGDQKRITDGADAESEAGEYGAEGFPDRDGEESGDEGGPEDGVCGMSEIRAGEVNGIFIFADFRLRVGGGVVVLEGRGWGQAAGQTKVRPTLDLLLWLVY